MRGDEGGEKEESDYILYNTLCSTYIQYMPPPLPMRVLVSCGSRSMAALKSSMAS